MKDFMNSVKENLPSILYLIFVVAVVGSLIGFSHWDEKGQRTFGGEIKTDKQLLCELQRKTTQDVRDGMSELVGVDIPQDAGGGCDPSEPAQMGANPYYKVDVSTPTAFYNAVNGRGFNEGYGLQCVAGFKEFMFALSGRYVATRTGGASGYANQQSQIEPLGFKWYSGSAGLKDGDWGIFGGGTYGHVAMRYQGKWFGQNQGAANGNVGNAFNLKDIGDRNLIGYYRPNIYATPVNPTSPETAQPTKPTNPSKPSAVATDSYVVKRGDTLGAIITKNSWRNNSIPLFGDNGQAQSIAESNGIENRGLIFPGQILKSGDKL